MSRARGLFASGIGRRLLLLFVIAAFVPIAAMTVIALTKVDSVLESALDEELAQSAKAYGMQVIDRLAQLQDQLEDAADPATWARLERDIRRTDGYFAGIALLASDGTIVRQIGMLPPDFRNQRRGAARTNGKTALAPSAASPESLLITRRTGGAGRGGLTVVAAPKLRHLWGDPDTYPALTEFCVATSAGVVMYCSRAVGLPALDWTALSHGSARALNWNDQGEPLRASAWSLFIESHFAGDDWIIIAIEPERSALEAAQSFRSALIPVALLALLVVLFVSSNQIRRILVPLQQLLAGTFKVGRQDFYPRLEINSRDEFGQLAGAFNDMADRLGLQFRIFAAFAEIDRSILTTLDLRDVCAIVTRCIKEIANVDIVSVALVEPDTPDRLRVFSVSDEAPGAWTALDFPCDPHAIAAAPPLQWTSAPSLPPAFLDSMRLRGAREFALIPVARGSFAFGTVVLAHPGRMPIPIERAAQIGGFVDRLAIALAAMARDKKLYDQAHFDALTGLPNRYHLLSLVTQSLARAQRQNAQVAVLFVDLDNFKRINDTLGHAAGDHLLQTAATRIRSAVREGDLVARLGGDEFTVVLDQLTDPRAIDAVAQKIIEVLSEVFVVEAQDMYLGASIGIAVFPSDGADAERLLKQADTAMYRAKALGRGRYAFFEDRMNAEANERARIDRELRLALQNDELILHYQPLLDLRNGRLDGAEALVRWQHPERGLLGPGAFIAIAEEGGLIEAIGARVLERACEQLARWHEQGVGLTHVSVNVSSRQLQRPDFFTRVSDVLQRNKLPPHALVLEVTESLFTDAAATQVLRRLREHGVGIAVDDFGTGYSSFAYLRALPISILKIDRAFIADVETSAAAATVARSIIQMAQALGKRVVAEGVETAAQLTFLERARCDCLQGYVVSRPVEAAALAAFLASHGRGWTLAKPSDPVEVAHAA